jgi:hypothetical protein
MNLAVCISVHLLLHMLSLDVLVKGDVGKMSHPVRRSPPEQLNHKLQKFNAQKYLGKHTEEVPTFLQRKDKNGNFLSAFQQDNWLEMHTSHTSNVLLEF